MLKETIISIIIVILILFGNNVTQNYTKDSIEELSNNLSQLKEKLLSKNTQKEELKNNINDIYEQWEEKHNKLAYFIEHDELEKVETNLTSIKSYIESEEDKDAINQLDISIFILKHLEDKYSFNLQNIF